METATSFVDLINQLKTTINEDEPSIVKKLLCNKKHDPNSFMLIDVRETEEWDEGYIFGSIHLSKGIIERDIEKYVPNKNTKIVLYCRSGMRSLLSAHNLQKMGYKNVSSMAGGIIAWQEANLPIIED